VGHRWESCLGGAPPPPCQMTVGGGFSVMTKMDAKVDLHISLPRPKYLPTLTVALFLFLENIDRVCQMLNSGINTTNRKMLLDLMRRITMGFML
jgi:hypothetical protein